MALLPTRLYTAAQTRELDAMAIQSGVSGYELMQKAGQAVLQLILEKYPGTGTLLIVCGAGNNAGDGYVLARLAANQGIQAKVLPLVEPATLTGDAAQAVKDWQQQEGLVVSSEAFNEPFDVVVDAMLGTGLSREIDGDYAEAVLAINRHAESFNSRVIAVDVPTGIQADTGAVLGCAVQADMTLSFIGLKQGLLTGHAPDYTGEVFFNALGIGEEIYEAMPASVTRIGAGQIHETLKPRRRTAHKGDAGHVLIIGGNRGMSGAVLIAGQAALRTGAGLVSIATRTGHASTLNVTQPELMCHGVSELKQLHSLIEAASVIAIGPGLGTDVWAQELFKAVVASEKPLVVDADALNLLAADYVQRDNWILTPHPGEAARMSGLSVRDVQGDRFSTAASLSEHYNAIIALKGAGTVIATPDKHCLLNTTGNPGMASGGMGDCLTGVVAALWAQGLSAEDAVATAVHIHGLAADRLAKNIGYRGIVATDLLEPLQRLVNP